MGVGEYGDNGKENGNYKDYRDYNRVYIGVSMLSLEGPASNHNKPQS